MHHDKKKACREIRKMDHFETSSVPNAYQNKIKKDSLSDLSKEENFN